MRFRRPRAFSTAGARRQARYRRRANSTDPSRSRRSVLHLVRELRGICSNRSAVAWGAPLIRWSDDGAIVLAARPIASLLAGLSPAGLAASLAALIHPVRGNHDSSIFFPSPCEPTPRQPLSRPGLAPPDRPPAESSNEFEVGTFLASLNCLRVRGWSHACILAVPHSCVHRRRSGPSQTPEWRHGRGAGQSVRGACARYVCEDAPGCPPCVKS